MTDPLPANAAVAVAVITGATRGIGFALAEAMLADGAIVHAVGVDAARVADAAARLRHPALRVHRLDVADGDAVARLLDDVAAEHGRLDWMINNAGVLAGGELADMSERQLRALVDVNVWGVIHGSRHAAARMRRHGRGRIVNVASMAAVLPVPYSAVYTATKHAVFGLSLALREELRAHGVGVHVVCPDIVDTGIFDRAIDNAGYSYRRIIDRHFSRAISAREAARHVLAGVARDQPIIYTPPRSRALGTLGRLFPSFFARQVGLRMNDSPRRSP
jgi:short-subunit dehydrogenase